jgi:arsenite methyltransferase
VLKAGGRLAISDVVALADMPPELAQSVEAMTGCVAGSAKVSELEALLRDAGFEDVRIVAKPESGAIIAQCMPGAEPYVASATIEGRKPGGSACCGPTCCA